MYNLCLILFICFALTISRVFSTVSPSITSPVGAGAGTSISCNSQQEQERDAQLSDDIFDESFYLTASKIESKLRLENNIPIFEFGAEMAAAVELAHTTKDTSNSLFKLELLHNEYMEKLRDYYFVYFRRSSGIDESLAAFEGGSNSKRKAVKDLELYKEKSILECEKAMKSASISNPSNNLSWSYNGYIAELKSDIESLVEELLSNELNEYHGDSQDGGLGTDTGTSVNNTTSKFGGGMFARRPFNRVRAFFKKRGKWIVAQFTLLMVNYLQNEMHRWVSIRAAERRLAEVPEFPLL